MNSLSHLTQKLLAERARNGSQQQPTPEIAPPPYSESDTDSSDDEDDDEDNEPPVKLLINAAHSIQGSNNLVPTSPTPLADATKFSTLLLHAVNQINAVSSNNHLTEASKQRRRPLRVDLTINCGITVIGDRNVIGNVAVKPKTPNGILSPTTATPSTVAGAKRKADESDDELVEPQCKKIAASEDVE